MNAVLDHRKTFLALAREFAKAIAPDADNASPTEDALLEQQALMLEQRAPGFATRLLHVADERLHGVALFECVLDKADPRNAEDLHRELLAMNARARTQGGFRHALDEHGRVVCSLPYLIDRVGVQDIVAAARDAMNFEASWRDDGLMVHEAASTPSSARMAV